MTRKRKPPELLPTKLFVIEENPDRITCGLCAMTSYNSEDVKHRFCGNCNLYLELGAHRVLPHRPEICVYCREDRVYDRLTQALTCTHHAVLECNCEETDE